MGHMAREGYRWFRERWRPSEAQRRVLDELAAGRTNAEIAVRLGLSAGTVKWHISQMLGETGCADRDALGRWWRERRARPPLVVPLLGFAGRAAAALAAIALAAVLLVAAGPAVVRLLDAARGASLRGSEVTPEPLTQATPAATATPFFTASPRGPAAVALYQQMVAALNAGDAEAVLGMYIEEATMPGAPCVLGCRNRIAGATVGVERSYGISCAVWHGYGGVCYGAPARAFQVHGQIANGVEIVIVRLVPADGNTPEYDAVGEIAWSSAAMRAAGERPFRSKFGIALKDERIWVNRTELPQEYVAEPLPPPPTQEATTDRRPVDGRIALAIAVGLVGVVLLLLGSVGLDLVRRLRRRAPPVP
jgi:DNA-binding CsgD family transcriptional regulator